MAHRTQRNSLLTRLLVSTKGCNSRIAKRKRSIGQGMWEGHRAPMLSPGMPLSPNYQLFTNLEALQTCSFEFVWRLHYPGVLMKSLAIVHLFSLQLLSIPWRWWGWTENPLITGLTRLATSLSLGDLWVSKKVTSLT